MGGRFGCCSFLASVVGAYRVAGLVSSNRRATTDFWKMRDPYSWLLLVIYWIGARFLRDFPVQNGRFLGVFLFITSTNFFHYKYEELALFLHYRYELNFLTSTN